MPDHDELIVLDFDHTLFNTTAFTAELRRRFKEKFGIDEATFDAKREEVKACCVVENLDDFARLLPHDDEQAIKDETRRLIMERASEYLFPDGLDFIARHRGQFDIVLLTHGDRELQGHKIRYAGIPSEIPVEIVQEEKGDVVAKYVGAYKRIHFIDDKAENIDSVKTRHPEVVAYFMKRPEDRPYGHIETECTCEHTVVEGLNFEIEAL